MLGQKKKKQLLDTLMQTHDEIVKYYRALLEVVRKEKEILIAADLDQLNDNNKVKEDLILKIKSLDSFRIKYSSDLAEHLGLQTEGNPRLQQLAEYFDGKDAEKMMNVKSVLEVIIKRVSELNKFNEELVKSALENITGAMDNIKNTLSEKPTYKKKGVCKTQATRSGRLVSREA